jgi:hypothetical protein
MPHYKCGACRIRVQIAQPPPVPIVVFCPECRSALDRAADLTELIGLRHVPFPGGIEHAGDEPGDGPTAAAVAITRPRGGL